MARRLMQIPYEGSKYDLYDTDITTSRLIQFKQWYGSDYGAYTPFMVLLFQFDAAALLCGLWTAKAKAGEPCDINNLDLMPSDVLRLFNENAEADAKKAETAAAKKAAAGAESGPTKPKRAAGTPA